MPAGINHAGSRGGNASVIVAGESFERVCALATINPQQSVDETAAAFVMRIEKGAHRKVLPIEIRSPGNTSVPRIIRADAS